MANPFRKGLALSALMLVAASAQQAQAQCLAPGFEGKWHGDDGGTYVITTYGGHYSWIGRSGDNGQSWINRFEGRYTKWHTISGEWHDTRGPGGRGTLTIKMIDDHTLVRIDSTGSPFGGTRWTRPRPPRGCPDTR